MHAITEWRTKMMTKTGKLLAISYFMGMMAALVFFILNF